MMWGHSDHHSEINGHKHKVNTELLNKRRRQSKGSTGGKTPPVLSFIPEWRARVSPLVTSPWSVALSPAGEPMTSEQREGGAVNHFIQLSAQLVRRRQHWHRHSSELVNLCGRQLQRFRWRKKEKNRTSNEAFQREGEASKYFTFCTCCTEVTVQIVW